MSSNLTRVELKNLDTIELSDDVVFYGQRTDNASIGKFNGPSLRTYLDIDSIESDITTLTNLFNATSTSFGEYINEFNTLKIDFNNIETIFNSLGDLALLDTVGASDIDDGSITDNKYADDSIGTNKLKNQSVTIEKGGTGASNATDARVNLGLGLVATLNSVGTPNLDDLSVINQKLASSAVSESKLAIDVLRILYSLPRGLPAFVASTTTITLPAGLKVMDSTNNHVLTNLSELTASTASTGVNGLDTGTVANNTWYEVYLIGDSNGVNPTRLLLSTSISSPTMPSGYDLLRNLGTPFRTFGTADLHRILYNNYGTHRVWGIQVEATWGVSAAPATLYLVANGGGATSFTNVVNSLCPPSAVAAHVIWEAVNGHYAMVRSHPDVAPSAIEQVLFQASGQHNTSSTWVALNSSNRFQYRVTGGTTRIASTQFLINGNRGS